MQGPPGLGLDAAAVHAGLHVSHEITWHRAIRPGDVLITSLALESLDQRSIGVFASLTFTTGTRDGEPVVDSRQGVLYVGAKLGEERAGTPRAARNSPAIAAETLRDVGSSASERPTPSSTRSAPASGTRSTPTLARRMRPGCRSRCCTAPQRSPGRSRRWSRRGSRGDPTSVRGLGCRFTAAVSAGDRVTVAASPPRPAETTGRGEVLDFVARTADGIVASAGFVELQRTD